MTRTRSTLLSTLLTTIISISLSAVLSLSHAQTLLDNGNLSGWTEKIFDGQTRYHSEGGALKATASDSGSGYFYEKNIPITAQSTLRWRWKIEQFPGAANEQTKAGDDFAGRVYVLKKGLFGMASARAIVYVWSEQYPVGQSWANPYTGKAIQVVVNSGQHRDNGGWQSVQRNIQADFKRYHGMDIDAIDAIAIMTDSDQSGTTAIAYYDDIRLE